MKISTHIDLVNGRYEVQVMTEFTAHETQRLLDLGEPVVNLGGNFAATQSRPLQTNTVLLFGGPGTGAEATVVIDVNGQILSATVTEGGADYSTAPAVTIAGDGNGAEITAEVEDGEVVGLTVDAGGSGYHVTPVDVDFDLPASYRRIKTDAPFRQTFDLADSVDADVKAKVWADTIVARLTEAKQTLLDRSVTFEGETVVTV